MSESLNIQVQAVLLVGRLYRVVRVVRMKGQCSGADASVAIIVLATGSCHQGQYSRSSLDCIANTRRANESINPTNLDI